MSDAAHNPGAEPSRCDAGEERARALTVNEFEAAFAASYKSLVVLAAATAGRGQAEDIVHEAAMIALKKLGTFERGTNFDAWMATIVRHTASNVSRGERRRGMRLMRFAQARRAAGSPGPRRSEAPPAAFSVQLQHALDALSAPQRECLFLRAALSRSYEQISAITGIPPATARSHVLRARRRLLEMSFEGGSERD